MDCHPRVEVISQYLPTIFFFSYGWPAWVWQRPALGTHPAGTLGSQ